MKRFVNYGVILFMIPLLAGCSKYQQYVNDKAQEMVEQVDEDSDNPTSSAELTVDQVREELNHLSGLQLGPIDFRLTQPINFQQNELTIEIQELIANQVTQVDSQLVSAFNYDTAPGGVIILQVSLTNEGTQSQRMSIDQSKVTYPDSQAHAFINDQLNADNKGNVVRILKDQQMTIAPGQTIQGSLVIGVGGTMYQAMKERGLGLLRLVVQPEAAESFIDQSEAIVALPLNEKFAHIVQKNADHLPDRSTVEMWGEKTLLARKKIDEPQAQQDIRVDSLQFELNNLEPFSDYEQMFENFPNGVIIATIAYRLTNQSQQPLSINEGSAKLTINNEPINDDPLLIVQQKHQTLAPGASATVIRSFALDRLHYVQSWQNQPISLSVSLGEPPASDQPAGQTPRRSSATELTALPMSYQFNWQFEPRWLRELDQNFKYVTGEESSLNGSDNFNAE